MSTRGRSRPPRGATGRLGPVEAEFRVRFGRRGAFGERWGVMQGRWGNWIMKIPWAGDCSFFSLIDGRIPSGSQGGSVQYLIQKAQTYVISILFSERKKKKTTLGNFQVALA